jgi:hypothetical protein
MNVNPHFRYYVAFGLLLLLVVLLRIQEQPTGAAEQVGQENNPMGYYVAGSSNSR